MTKPNNDKLAQAANDSGAFAPFTVVAGKPAKAKAKAKGKKAAKGKAPAKAKAAAKGKPAAKAKAPRANSKQADFIAAMKTAKGISIAEAAKRFDWQAHTVRGAVAGALKKKLGLKIEATKEDERGTVYRIK